ncbi:LppA family lipoprotein [Haloechinothrix halophila]|uniref:LppA family lipoprotein n=1 Tax=Haloechinothrix halophila TaxID=1069073 RepID=UPI0038B33B2B
MEQVRVCLEQSGIRVDSCEQVAHAVRDRGNRDRSEQPRPSCCSRSRQIAHRLPTVREHIGWRRASLRCRRPAQRSAARLTPLSGCGTLSRRPRSGRGLMGYPVTTARPHSPLQPRPVRRRVRRSSSTRKNPSVGRGAPANCQLYWMATSVGTPPVIRPPVFPTPIGPVPSTSSPTSTSKHGFGEPKTVADRRGDHEVAIYDRYGAELIVGTAKNTILSLSTGCHLSRDAHRRGTPDPGSTTTRSRRFRSLWRSVQRWSPIAGSAELAYGRRRVCVRYLTPALHYLEFFTLAK